MLHATSLKLVCNFSFHWISDCTGRTGHRKEYGCATTELWDQAGGRVVLLWFIDTEVSIHINNDPDNDNHLPYNNDIGLYEIWARSDWGKVLSVIIFQICDGAQCQTLPISEALSCIVICLIYYHPHCFLTDCKAGMRENGLKQWILLGGYCIKALWSIVRVWREPFEMCRYKIVASVWMVNDIGNLGQYLSSN